MCELNNSKDFRRYSVEGGAFMNMVKSLNTKMFVLMAGVAIAVAALIPAIAMAADYPGVDDGTVTTGNTAQTEVGLKADESQLSFTAPAVINFAMKADGTFEYPTNAKFTNNSIFDLRVKSYVVTSDASVNAHGVSSADYDTATEANTYKLQVKPGTGSLVDFAVSQATLSATDWLIGHTAGATTLGITFDNGVMKNVTSGTWVDGHKLQDVVWTVAAA